MGKAHFRLALTNKMSEIEKKFGRSRCQNLMLWTSPASQLAFALRGLPCLNGISLAMNFLIMEHQSFEEVRAIVDRVRQFLAADCISPSRRQFLKTSAA